MSATDGTADALAEVSSAAVGKLLADALITLSPLFAGIVRRGALGVNLDVTRIGHDHIGFLVLMRGTLDDARAVALMIKKEASWAGVSLRGDAEEGSDETRAALPDYAPQDAQLIALTYTPSLKTH